MWRASSMEKYLVSTPKALAKTKRFQWGRNLIELNGKFDSSYRHRISSLLMQSYALAGAFPHVYHINDGALCQTHVNWVNGGGRIPRLTVESPGVSALEFDSKGTYLASVTKSGCLTIYDYDELVCKVKRKNPAVKEDETKQVLHISTGRSLDVVRWNPGNQYEVVCTSRRSEVYIYDIGYVSSEPVEILKKRPDVGIHGCTVGKGYADVALSSDDDKRVLASDMLGFINIWDRRIGKHPCLDLTSYSRSPINSIKFSVDNQVIFGASKSGMIYMWDIRGGRSFTAFQSTSNKASYSPITSVKLSYELEKIGSLKAQSNIAPKEILSIDQNPSCPHQLAFHLDDGWSGVFDTHDFKVTHIHCPPPRWLDDRNELAYLSYMRKPTWLPTHSIYMVGSSSDYGLHLLDFYRDSTSPCHVEHNEDLQGMVGTKGKEMQNIFIPLPEDVTACAAHPLYGDIVAGTELSSLYLLTKESVCPKEDG